MALIFSHWFRVILWKLPVSFATVETSHSSRDMLQDAHANPVEAPSFTFDSGKPFEDLQICFFPSFSILDSEINPLQPLFWAISHISQMLWRNLFFGTSSCWTQPARNTLHTFKGVLNTNCCFPNVKKQWRKLQTSNSLIGRLKKNIPNWNHTRWAPDPVTSGTSGVIGPL